MRLTVNGEVIRTEIPDSTMLIRFLREHLGLHGVRPGCGIGECGACTVLVNGSPIRSCITPISEVADSETLTPEGLGVPDAPHPVQEAFLREQAAQCGYCVNGMIMSVAGMAGDEVQESDLVEALDDHICRCGTQIRLLAAARRALNMPAPETRRGTCRVAEVPTEAASVSGTPRSTDEAVEELPPILRSFPHVEQWLELQSDGSFVVHPGKVEIGQGIRTALAQIAAAGLGVGLPRVRLGPTETGRVPDERYTSGSESIEEGGTALAYAAVACRRLLLDRASRHLDAPTDRLVISDDGVRDATGPGRVSFRDLAGEGPIRGPIEETDRPRWVGSPLGEAIPRLDLPAKLTGSPAYLHDVARPGMLHARAVLPPSPSARLVAAPVDPVRERPGITKVVVDGDIVLVIAENEETAVRGVEQLRRVLSWQDPASTAAPDVEALYRAGPFEPFPVRQDPDAEQALRTAAVTHAATYAGPYQAHGAITPSVAVAETQGDRVTVWSHTQGIYPLRRELAVLFSLDEGDVTVIHADGPGCYGMNGADDAAAFAVMAARALPGRPVRFGFSVEDEFGWEPYGPAMVIDMAAGLDGGGRISAWRHHAISDVHKTRPNGRGDRLAISWLRDGGNHERPWPGPEEGGARNANPIYDLPAVDALTKYVRGPLRTSSLRCLGAYLNVFAAESFIDELADAAQRDPVEFRLAHLTDARARRVLEIAAARAGWTAHVGPTGQGHGIAVAHYKNSRAYVAQAADVAVDPDTGELTVHRIVVVCDPGAVVNPDGLSNQLEGGVLQGLSRALYEELHPARSGVREHDWTTYGTLRFRDIPELEIHLAPQPGHPPLGVGEAATPVVPAVLANAIYDAVGIRLRRLPLNAAQLERRLLEMDDHEAAKVRL